MIGPKWDFNRLLHGPQPDRVPTVTDVPSDEPVLYADGLTVDFWSSGQWVRAVDGIDLSVARGETLALVGESGSGKSTAAMAILGLLPPNARIQGSIRFHGRELVGAKAATWQALRGNNISMIFQEPMTAMNPVYTVGFQIAEVLRNHHSITPKAAKKRAVELLDMVAIPDPASRVDSYPHQLSGGQRQRAMIAMALASEPQLLIADEPTTALDVTVQADILELIRELSDRIDAGVLLITHDMGVAADIADRVMVLKDGAVVESGTATAVFAEPAAEYTRTLLSAVPHLGGSDGAHALARPAADNPGPDDNADPDDVVLRMRQTVISYKGRGSANDTVAVDGVDLSIRAGEVVGLVGESGSGKSTIGRAVVGLLTPTAGELTVAGVDMVNADRRRLRQAQDNVAIVFQDPGSSLNPRWPIGDSIGEPLRLKRRLRGAELNHAVEGLLDQVQLSSDMRNRYPHELSGGQRQRVGIARALALTPKLLVADEPTSALDVSVQATVLDLFATLQHEHGFACLFITHDLAVIEQVSDRVTVMQRGKVVESGPTSDVLTRPREAYTQRLLAAVPIPDPTEQRRRRELRLHFQSQIV